MSSLTSPERPSRLRYASNAGNVMRLAIAQALAGINAPVVFATAPSSGTCWPPARRWRPCPSLLRGGHGGLHPAAGVIAQRHGPPLRLHAGDGLRRSCGASGLARGRECVLLPVLRRDFPGRRLCRRGPQLPVCRHRLRGPERRPRALSAVMAGGVFAGILGPQLVTYTMDLWAPYLFAATYVGQAVAAGLSPSFWWACACPCRMSPNGRADGPWASSCGSALPPRRDLRDRLLPADELPDDGGPPRHAPVRPLPGSGQSRPAMARHRHVCAELWTGSLISRFRRLPCGGDGARLHRVRRPGRLMGIGVGHFWAMLVLLGVGWNFGFVGASAMVLECHRPEERRGSSPSTILPCSGRWRWGSFLSEACSRFWLGTSCSSSPSARWSGAVCPRRRSPRPSRRCV